MVKKIESSEAQFFQLPTDSITDNEAQKLKRVAEIVTIVAIANEVSVLKKELKERIQQKKCESKEISENGNKKEEIAKEQMEMAKGLEKFGKDQAEFRKRIENEHEEIRKDLKEIRNEQEKMNQDIEEVVKDQREFKKEIDKVEDQQIEIRNELEKILIKQEESKKKIEEDNAQESSVHFENEHMLLAKELKTVESTQSIEENVYSSRSNHTLEERVNLSTKGNGEEDSLPKIDFKELESNSIPVIDPEYNDEVKEKRILEKENTDSVLKFNIEKGNSNLDKQDEKVKEESLCILIQLEEKEKNIQISSDKKELEQNKKPEITENLVLEENKKRESTNSSIVKNDLKLDQEKHLNSKVIIPNHAKLESSKIKLTVEQDNELSTTSEKIHKIKTFHGDNLKKENKKFEKIFQLFFRIISKMFIQWPKSLKTYIWRKLKISHQNQYPF